MSKEKLKSMETYLAALKIRLDSSVIPSKHTHRPDSYKNFLKNEIKTASAKLEELKLEGTK